MWGSPGRPVVPHNMPASLACAQGGCTRPTTRPSTEPTFPPPTESSTWSTGSCCPETTNGAPESPCHRLTGHLDGGGWQQLLDAPCRTVCKGPSLFASWHRFWRSFLGLVHVHSCTIEHINRLALVQRFHCGATSHPAAGRTNSGESLRSTVRLLMTSENRAGLVEGKAAHVTLLFAERWPLIDNVQMGNRCLGVRTEMTRSAWRRNALSKGFAVPALRPCLSDCPIENALVITRTFHRENHLRNVTSYSAASNRAGEE